MTQGIDPYSAVSQAVRKFHLCRHHVWSSLNVLSPEQLVGSIPQDHIVSHTGHENCTYSSCESTHVDNSLVQQRHECRPGRCKKVQFPKRNLVYAVKKRLPTAWEAIGPTNPNTREPCLIKRGQDLMAISHVWADGTGAGAGHSGSVNHCLYSFFSKIAIDFDCDGVWWDTISIPDDQSMRKLALNTMHENYEDARITLVHDCYLRESPWVDAETACFAILMSPWFSRGWTLLELARSQRIKVLFKGPRGSHDYVIKDLDHEILMTNSAASEAIRRIRRSEITDINDLLTALRRRYTSRKQDIAIIAGHLTRIDLSKVESPQAIYQAILKKIGRVAHGHLFHNSVTMRTSFSWCCSNLFKKFPLAPSTDGFLHVMPNGNVVGEWELFRPAAFPKERYTTQPLHSVVQVAVDKALKDDESQQKLLLLVEPSQVQRNQIHRAILVRPMWDGEIVCQFIGPVYFHPMIKEDSISEAHRIGSRSFVCIGNTEGMEEPDTAWWDLPSDLESIQSSENNVPSESHDRESRQFNSKVLAAVLRQGPTENILRFDKEVSEEEILLTIFRGGDDLEKTFIKELIPRTRTPARARARARKPRKLTPDLRYFATSPPKNKVDMRFFLDMLVPPISIRGKQKEGLLAAFIKAREGDIHSFMNRLFPSRPEGSDMLSSLLQQTLEHELLDSFLDSRETRVEEFLEQMNPVPNSGGLKQLAAALQARIEDDLETAALEGDEEGVKKFLKAVIISADDSKTWTPLHRAVWRGHLRIVGILLKETSELSIDTHGRHVFHLAAERGRKDMLEQLWEWAASRGITRRKDLLEDRCSDGETVLHRAAWGGSQEVVEQVLSWAQKGRSATGQIHNTSVGRLSTRREIADLQDKFGRTALHIAAQHGYNHVARLLLKDMRDPHLRERNGRTGLHFAAQGGHHDIVKALLESSPEPKDLVGLQDRDNKTALHLAAECGHISVATILLSCPLSHDTDSVLNIQDDLGQTPLHVATECKHIDMVNLLLKHSANPWIRDKCGQSVLHIAARKGLSSMTSKLRKACSLRHVRRKESPEIRDEKGKTPLHIAAEYGHADLVKQLLEELFDPIIPRNDGRTVLHVAVQHEHVEIVRSLVQNARLRGHSVKTRTLMDKEDGSGETAEDIARKVGNTAIIDELQNARRSLL